MNTRSIVRNTCFVATSLLSAFAAFAAQPAPDKEDVISFDLVANPAFVDCLRANYNEEPRAHATVYRGKVNDTLVLDLYGFKPGLQFDLFTIEHSPFFDDGARDPAFTGSFGMAWYQSDIEINKRGGSRTQIRTILLDQIFGFDADVGLNPVNTFHVGFWFNDPNDAQPCSTTPIKPTPFNGEHQAGPFAMISATSRQTTLGPLCTAPIEGTTPAKCDP
jgi:hypothetical protein